MSRLGVLADREFAKLWAGTSVSFVGTQVSALALPLLAILVLHAGPGEMGVLAAVEGLPFLLVGLPAGVWIDRLRRRPILIVADVGRAATMATVPVAATLGVLTLQQLYVVGFVFGILSVFGEVAYTSYLPGLVPRKDVVEANAKLEASRAVSSVAGPGLAGLVIAAVGAAVALAADALSFLVSGLAIAAIRRPEPPPVPPADGKRSMRREITSGLRWVFRHQTLRVVLASNTIANVSLSMFQTLVLLFLVRDLGLTPSVIGIVLTTANVASIAGSLLAVRIARRIGVGLAIAAAWGGEALAELLLAFAPTALPIPVVFASQALFGFVAVVGYINALSLRQSVTPDAMLGRMTATYRFASWGVLPLGAGLAGVLGTAIGVRPTLFVVAAIGGMAITPILLSGVRSMRTLPVAADEMAAADEGVSPAG